MSTTVIPLDDLPSHPSSTRKFGGATAGATKKPSMTTSAMSSRGNGSTRRKDTQRPIQESEIDMENLPVIQGSFEITKTDADIAQKRTNARPASTASQTPNTLKPFYITPGSSIKVKTSGQASPTTSTIKPDNIVEMFLQHQKNLQQKAKETGPVTAKIEKTNKVTTKMSPVPMTVTKKMTPMISTTSTTTTITTEKSVSVETTTTDPLKAPQPPPLRPPQDYNESQINKDLPKLDVSLFTSAPVLDNEPWRPINPSPAQIKTNFPSSTTETTNAASASESTLQPPYRSPFNPEPIDNVVYRNKFVDPDMIYPLNETDESVLYQSFYNPDFSAGSLEIEKLGMADVRPYPLPVNKIDLSEEVRSSILNLTFSLQMVSTIWDPRIIKM
jgi:hypothetical protein